MAHKTPLSALFPFLLALLLGGLAPQATAGEKVGAGGTAIATKNHVIIQDNEEDSKKWHAVLVNITNIQTDFGRSKVAIKVVAIGAGLGMVTAESLAANGVQDAIDSGGEFLACGNSMRAQHVAPADLIDGVQVVTAGYGEIIRRQQQGWAYLRP